MSPPSPPGAIDRDALKYSVQGLQRIYAFIIALAVGTALTKLLVNPLTGTPDIWRLASAPGLIFAAFMVTVVPFFHGMNRHLDDLYALGRTPKSPTIATAPPRPGAIMLDLFVFVLEASLLYTLALAVLDSDAFFLVFAILLGVDTLWAFVTWLITGSPAIKWAAINVISTPLILVCRDIESLSPEGQLILLSTLVLLRAIIDYAVNWRFYFPSTNELNAPGTLL